MKNLVTHLIVTLIKKILLYKMSYVSKPYANKEALEV